MLVTAVRRGHRPSWPVLAWLAGLALLGAYAERGVAWWAFGAPVALAPTVAALLPPARAPRAEPAVLRRLNAVIVGVLGLVVVLAQPAWRGAIRAQVPTAFWWTRRPAWRTPSRSGRAGGPGGRRAAGGVVVRMGIARRPGHGRFPGGVVPESAWAGYVADHGRRPRR